MTENWGGRREGAGRKADTPEKRLERALREAEKRQREARRLAEHLFARVGLPPRRRLLAGEDVEERTDGPWLAAFCREFCKQSIGRFSGLPLELYPEQQAFVDDALAFDDEGRRLYTTAVWGVPRKNGKSTLTGAIGLALGSPAEGEGKPIGVFAAGSKEQAEPTWDQVTDFIHADPVLRSIYVAQKLSIDSPVNGAKIKRVAGDGKLNHGLNPYFVVADELHAWVTPKQRENWAALTTADAARDDAVFLVISTAGWDLESILGSLYRGAFESPYKETRPDMGGGGFVVRDPDARLLVHWYAIHPGTPFTDLDEFKRANPAPWRTKERIRGDLGKKTAGEPEKRRLYGNEWTSARDRWISAEDWEACKGETEIPEGAPIFVGVDAALTRDTSAVAWAWKADDGRIVLRARVWTARADVAAHIRFTDGRIDNEEVAGFVRERLAARYAVQELVYDPRYFESQAQHLGEEGFVVAPLEPGSEESRRAWDAFHGAVTDHEVEHAGDRVLTAHVAGAAGSMTDRGWKVSKIKQNVPIDGLAACVIAHSRACRGEDRSVYESRGLIAV